MLDSKFIRENPDAVRKAIRDKHIALDLDVLLAADRTLLELSRELQLLQEKRNQNAKSIPKASQSERAALIATGREIGEAMSLLKPDVERAELALRDLLCSTSSLGFRVKSFTARHIAVRTCTTGKPAAPISATATRTARCSSVTRSTTPRSPPLAFWSLCSRTTNKPTAASGSQQSFNLTSAAARPWAAKRLAALR